MAGLVPIVKPDPDLARASPALSDQDIYVEEEAGDLEFNEDPQWKQLYLARIPKQVWEAWASLDDDAEIEVGMIRQVVETKPDGARKQTLGMLLRSDLAVHQGIAKEYEFDFIDGGGDARNTFVFSEQDLPGYKSKYRQKFNPTTANMPQRLQRLKKEKPDKDKPSEDPDRKWTPYVKKPVPKRTILAGKIKTEVNLVEVDNEESRHLLEVRTLESLRPKRTTKFIKDDESGSGHAITMPGSVAADQKFNFVRTNKGGKKTQQSKAARIPQNELLDMLFDCFRTYNYWSMKALRAKLQQPEAYLRETLEKIAVLAKSGTFNAHWSLKPENKAVDFSGADGIAPASEIDEDSDTNMDDDDDEDEDIKFEDA